MIRRLRDASRVLYVIVCAAGPAGNVGIVVEQAQVEGWTVCVVVTPNARAFIDLTALEELTGLPVRVEYREPGEASPVPPADAMLVAPATFNTINKWAAGVSDTLALSLINEAIGMGIPVVAMPFVNNALAAHPAFASSVERLRQAGVRVIFGPGEPHPPGGGGPFAEAFAWHLGLAALRVPRARGLPHSATTQGSSANSMSDMPDVHHVLERHVELFNAGVRQRDFSGMLSQFADEAVMRFEGVPVGPLEGRLAIAAAYRDQPPDDEIRVLDTNGAGSDCVTARYAWAAAPEQMAGRMRLCVRDGLIAELVVTFESS